MPVVRPSEQGHERRQPRHLHRGAEKVHLLGRVLQGDDPRSARPANSTEEVRMTEKRNNHSPLRLTLPSATVKRLAEAAIHCRPEVGLEYQRSASRHVLRGREAGGATHELGRYVSCCAVDGQRLPWLIRPDSLARNGDHAIVVAPLLVSIEMFRFEHTYELLILRHTIVEAEKGKRPAVSSQ